MEYKYTSLVGYKMLETENTQKPEQNKKVVISINGFATLHSMAFREGFESPAEALEGLLAFSI